MSIIKFTLRIYSLKKDITPDGGISLGEFSEIVGALSKAIELGDIKCTINEVHNEAYNLVVATEDDRAYGNYVDLWKNIEKSNGHLLLRESQSEFGNVVSKFTKRDIFFAGLDKDEKLLGKVEKVITEGIPKHFFEVDDVYGRIIEVGGRNEEKPHIRVKKLDGETLLIHTTAEQDAALAKYYKKVDNIYFSVRYKINFLDHSIISCSLDDYSIPGNYRLHEAVDVVNEKYPNLFEGYDPTSSIIENRQ
jgi:hypothetical protein